MTYQMRAADPDQDRAAQGPTAASGPTGWRRRWANSPATLPLRLFLAAVFLFAAYAKLSYPGFFDPNSTLGFHSAVLSAKNAGTPLSGLMGPMIDHSSFFGHVTAFAELAIGLGLLVGLLTRIAAAGGIALTAMIVLSVNWPSVKEYTGNGGWFTSNDLVTMAALSVFLLGGAGSLSLDAAYGAMRRRRRARQDAAEPPFSDRDEELENSRRRLRGEPYGGGSEQYGGGSEQYGGGSEQYGERTPDQPTAQLPYRAATPHQAPYQTPGQDDENSLWNNGPR